MRFLNRRKNKNQPLRWIVFFALAVLLHGIFLKIPLNWMISKHQRNPVEVQAIHPQEIKAIRQLWKNKAFILSKLKSKKNLKLSQKKNPLARYFSDQTQFVKKEQQARNSKLIPSLVKGKNPDLGPGQKSVPPSPRFSPSGIRLSRLGLGLPLPRTQVTQERYLGGPSFADQTLLDPQLQLGSQNLINTEESIYYSFYSRLYHLIAPVWQSQIRNAGYHFSILPGDYTTSVDLVLNEDGELLRIALIQNSGIDQFDKAVDHSIQKIQRFPNPPHDLIDQNREVHIAWTFRVRLK